MTVIALGGLVLYWLLAAPHFEIARVMAGPMLPTGWDGVMAAVPFACAAKNNPQVSQVALSSHLSREPGMKYALEQGGLKAEDVLQMFHVKHLQDFSCAHLYRRKKQPSGEYL